MRKVFMITAIISIFIISNCVHAIASEITQEQLLKEIEYLKSRITVLEKKVSEVQAGNKQAKTVTVIDPKTKEQLKKEVVSEIQEDMKTTLPKEIAGIKIGVSATMVIQGALDTNRSTENKEDVTDGSYQVDFMFEKELGDYGHAFAQLECGDGISVMDELEVFSNVDNNNDDTDNNAELTKVWYQHYFYDKQLAVSLGKWDPTDTLDTNTIANDDSCQFLAEIFNNSPALSNDLPSKAPGIWATLTPNGASWLEVQGLLFTGDGAWEDMGDHLQVAPQITIKPQLKNGLEGNYRFYGWYRNTDYTKWSDRNEDKKHRYGFGLSLDQQLSDMFSLFGRYGWENPDVYDPGITSSSGTNFSVEQSWSAGFQINGKLWNRDSDRIAAAFGSVMPSDKYKEYGGTDLKADDEYHAEAYYYWRVNEYFSFSPDLQVIWNPFGNDYVVNSQRRDQAITVIGCRGHLDF